MAHLVDGGKTSDTSAPPKDMSTRAKETVKDAKLKAKRLLRIDETKQSLREDENGAPSKIDHNPAFNPSLTLNAESSTLGHIKDQLPGSMQELAHTIRHPRSATKGKASDTMATSEEPYISRSDDEDLLKSHKMLEQAESSRDDDSESEEQYDDWKITIDELEESRERKKVAWTLSRYIHRARVVMPGLSTFPVLSSCRWVDRDGKPQGQQWAQWLDHIRDLLDRSWNDQTSAGSDEKPVWDQDLLLQQVERIVMASSPWQNWLLRVGQLWRWDNTWKTGTWFAIWLLVWYYNRIFTFTYGYVIFNVIQHRLGPERREALQESHARVSDEDATPNTFGEMISRHGSSGWLDPMLEYVGPVIQPQIKDLADWMEVFMNFYEWKTPRATIVTLFSLGSLITLATFASTDFNLRITTLMAILMFFMHRPVSSRYPNYLQLLAPLHWIFWGIPTHSETSFRYLRIQAEEMRGAALKRNPNLAIEKPDASPVYVQSGPPLASPIRSMEDKPTLNHTRSMTKPTNSDIFATACKWHEIKGSVVISFNDIRFVRSFPKHEMWHRQFHELMEIKKGNGQTSIIKKHQNFLELYFEDGSTEKLESLKKKDELFNIIIAFSGLTWQQIQL